MAFKRIIVLLCMAATMSTLAACVEEETDGGSGDSSSNGSSDNSGDGGGDGKSEKDCGTKATDDCTPRVGPNKSVRVDALTWSVKDARSTTALGDQEFGLGEEADGRFIVVSLEVTSNKSESVTLTDNAFQLEVDGKKYDTDSEGTIAAVGAGDEPFFLEDIGPDSTVSGKVVFDVPESVLSKKPAMRFNELGFGSTHGFIRLPRLGSS